MHLRLLDLDGSLPGQEPLARRAAAGKAELVDLRQLGPSLRLWALTHSFRQFEEAWQELPPLKRPALILVGSGDFHHLTARFVADAPGPLSVIHFDNHPDWCWTVPRRHCGSWVNEVLSMPHVHRVVTIGPCSDDLERPDRKGANLAALSCGRLEVFAWRRAPSSLASDIAPGAGHDVAPKRIVWRNLAGRNWRLFLEELASRLPTERLWISIDKDVLGPDEAVTNWDQGDMPLGHILEALRYLAGRFRIVGADICGEYAVSAYRNPLKWFEARLDQPARPRGVDLEVNAVTNERLVAAFEEVL